MLEIVAARKLVVFICALLLSLFLLASGSVEASDPKVKFDVPAIAGATLVVCEGHLANLDKQIEIVVPVTSESNVGDHESISVFRFDIYWNRLAYPIADYSPKTQTASPIAGNVLVEQVNEKNAGLGLSVGGGSDTLVTAKGSIDLGSRETSKKKFEQIPQQDLLVASGTSHRGMGAFFRFHPSKQSSLEGGRKLRLRFRVPAEWRGGVLRVDCFAEGKRVVLPGWSDSFEFSRTFVLPVYLATDAEARSAATDFVRSEQGLRQQWHLSRPPKIRGAQSQGFPALPNWLSRSTPAAGHSLPDQWVHYLIQSGNDAYLEKYRSQLPQPLADSADQFVAARQRLLTFSRR